MVAKNNAQRDRCSEDDPKPFTSAVGAVEPGQNDVLCGRGDNINRHPGNKYFRKLVEKKKKIYSTSQFKREKRMIAGSILSTIWNLNPPGRFLSKDQKSGSWHEIGDEKAREKTSQALREKASSLRGERDDAVRKQRAADEPQKLEGRPQHQPHPYGSVWSYPYYYNYGPPIHPSQPIPVLHPSQVPPPYSNEQNFLHYSFPPYQLQHQYPYAHVPPQSLPTVVARSYGPHGYTKREHPDNTPLQVPRPENPSFESLRTSSELKVPSHLGSDHNSEGLEDHQNHSSSQEEIPENQESRCLNVADFGSAQEEVPEDQEPHRFNVNDLSSVENQSYDGQTRCSPKQDADRRPGPVVLKKAVYHPCPGSPIVARKLIRKSRADWTSPSAKRFRNSSKRNPLSNQAEHSLRQPSWSTASPNSARGEFLGSLGPMTIPELEVEARFAKESSYHPSVSSSTIGIEQESHISARSYPSHYKHGEPIHRSPSPPYQSQYQYSCSSSALEPIPLEYARVA